ncbi:hypothetical protein BC831DRAFT_480393 [Entophlyctis helioformis]|nr:hypothetical protein BC831DRAFT_480393 [Entophlyctis helioformis]
MLSHMSERKQPGTPPLRPSAPQHSPRRVSSALLALNRSRHAASQPCVHCPCLPTLAWLLALCCRRSLGRPSVAEQPVAFALATRSHHNASFHVSIGASWSTVRHALANPDNVPPAGMAGCEGGRMQAGWMAWRRCGRADRVRARHRLQTQTHNRSAPDCAHCCCALVVAALKRQPAARLCSCFVTT